MSIFFVENATVLSVERAGAIDRYGRSKLETISEFHGVGVNVRQRTRFVRNPQGEQVQLDAVMISEFRLRTRDVVTIENEDLDRYEVFSLNEIQNPATGITEYYRYEMTRKVR